MDGLEILLVILVIIFVLTPSRVWVWLLGQLFIAARQHPELTLLIVMVFLSGAGIAYWFRRRRGEGI